MTLTLRPTRTPRREKRGEIPASIVIAPATADATHPDRELGALFDRWRNSALAVEHVLHGRQLASPDELARRDAAGGATLAASMERNADQKLERLADQGAATVAGIALLLEAAFHRGVVPDPGAIVEQVLDAARLDALRLAESELPTAR